MSDKEIGGDVPDAEINVDVGDGRVVHVKVSKAQFIMSAYPLAVVEWAIISGVHAAYEPRVAALEQKFRDLKHEASGLMAFLASEPGLQDKFLLFLKTHKTPKH